MPILNFEFVENLKINNKIKPFLLELTDKLDYKDEKYFMLWRFQCSRRNS